MGGKESFIILIIFFLIFSSFLFTSLAATSSDTLKQSDKVDFSSSTNLVSEGKVFTLGFFTAPYTNYSFLGIWFTVDSRPPHHPVWVGNRNMPITNNSGVLTIDSAGKLIITHDGGKPIELYHSQTGTNITATLLDTGNFIVREANNNESIILWESFDYPAHVLLPGMKLGVNHRTGRNWSLTSWLSGNLPTPGAFNLDWDPSGCRLIVRRQGVIYWTSGMLREKSFEFLNAYPSNFNYKFINVTNKDEEYFTYSIATPKEVGVVTGWWLYFTGDIYDASDSLMAQVSLCYGYNTDGGCELWEQPKCRNSYQKFDLKSGRFRDINNINDAAWISDNNESLSISDCRANCWNDCDCIGFTGGPGCYYWKGNSVFYPDSRGSVLFVLISKKASEPLSNPPSELLSDPPNKRRKDWIWILIAVGIAFIMIVFSLLCYLRRRNIRLKGKDETRNMNDLIDLMEPNECTNTMELENDDTNGNDLKIFSFGDIIAATNSFSPENKLGEGGFGPVYKGKLVNGTEIAVKRLSERSRQGVVEFKNELILIAKLQHVNLVRLLGCHIHGDDKMLVYEYMLNKSLDYYLFDPTRKEQLSWKTRFNIIEGIAQGLLYLHKYSRLKIIHRDLKASNILLDENMNPKIFDFGMARIFKQNVLEANTNRVVGTYGYMAPEYAMEGMFSMKSDVFSFGVLMLEIVSGQKNNNFNHLEGPLNLVVYAWNLWSNDTALELMDPVIRDRDSCIIEQILRCIHVGLLCAEDCAADRPTMSNVISMLTNNSITLPLPKKPAFVFRSYVNDEGDSSKSELEKHSINELSSSVFDAR